MLVRIKKRLGGDAGNAARLSLGTMIGQLVSIVTLPIFARIYGAHVVGIWTFLNSIALIVNAFSDLGLSFSLMTVQKEKTETIYSVITTLVFFMSVLFGGFLVLYYTLFATNDTGLSPAFLAVYMALHCFTTQQLSVCYTWLNRDQRYDVLMKNPILNTVVFSLVGIPLGLLGFTKHGYFIGWLLGQTVTLWHMKRYLPRKFFTFRLDAYRQVFRENIHFVKLQMPNNAIAAIKNQLPSLLIKAFFGPDILGFYGISVRILNIPTFLLGNAVGKVFFQKASSLAREGKAIGEYTLRNLTRMMKVAVIPMLLVVVFGKAAIGLFLGPRWAEAGTMLVCLSFRVYFSFITISVSGISVALHRQDAEIVMHVAQIVTSILSLLIGRYVFNDIYITCLLLSITYVAINIAYFAYMFQVMDLSPRRYLVSATTNLLLIGGVGALLFLLLQGPLDGFVVLLRNFVNNLRG